MDIGRLVGDSQIVAIICNQWGDSGKGKFSDFLADRWADVIARGTGGANAGHTVILNGQEIIFHLIPAGISYDRLGKVNILGNGMVIDPITLTKEFDELDRRGISYNNLMISDQAHVTLPFHVGVDKAKNASQKSGGIGSTGRGIGPTYEDKIARRGIMMGDLIDRDNLVAKLRKHGREGVDDLVEQLKPAIERIKPFVRDTVSEMHKYVRQRKRIVLEGAQGLGLSIEHGTYPFVTSSDCSVNGTASGVGLSATAVDLTLGIVKFPFMTRVGGGPFPTEFGGKRSENYCAEEQGNRKVDELAKQGVPFTKTEDGVKYDREHPIVLSLMNSDDEFSKGVGIRLAAGEYGATTGRPRRTGWTDAVMGRYAVAVNGPRMKLVLTKPDSVSGIDEFKICTGYQMPDGSASNEFPRNEKVLNGTKPLYKSYPGYGDISGAREIEDLPRSLGNAIRHFERFAGAKVGVVSTGAGPEQTIIV